MKLLDRLERWTRSRAALWTLLAILPVSVAIFRLGPYADLAALDSPVFLFDERVGYDAGEAEACLQGLGTDGRALYARFLWMDSFFAVLNGALFVVLIGVSLRRMLPTVERRSLFLLVPLVGIALDWGENAAIATMLAEDGIGGGSSLWASGLTALKFVASGLGFLTAVAGGLSWIVRRAPIAVGPSPTQ